MWQAHFNPTVEHYLLELEIMILAAMIIFLTILHININFFVKEWVLRFYLWNSAPDKYANENKWELFLKDIKVGFFFFFEKEVATNYEQPDQVASNSIKVVARWLIFVFLK